MYFWNTCISPDSILWPYSPGISSRTMILSSPNGNYWKVCSVMKSVVHWTSSWISCTFMMPNAKVQTACPMRELIGYTCGKGWMHCTVYTTSLIRRSHWTDLSKYTYVSIKFQIISLLLKGISPLPHFRYFGAKWNRNTTMQFLSV